MKKLFYSALSAAMLLTFSTSAFSQTKAEKKVKATGIDVGMYEGTKSKEAQKYYDAAIEKHKAEDYKGAIKIYDKCIKEDPKFIEAYDNRAVCYRRLGDFKNAIEDYKKSIELYPEGKMAHQNLGLIYGIEKKYDEAIAQYEIVQKLDSTDAEGYFGTINIYLGKGDYKSAVKNAAKTLEIYEATSSPFVSEAQCLLGMSYYYDGDKEKAKTYFTLAKKAGYNVPEQFKKELKIK